MYFLFYKENVPCGKYLLKLRAVEELRVGESGAVVTSVGEVEAGRVHPVEEADGDDLKELHVSSSFFTMLPSSLQYTLS